MIKMHLTAPTILTDHSMPSTLINNRNISRLIEQKKIAKILLHSMNFRSVFSLNAQFENATQL